MAEKQSFMNVTEVAKELGISESHAYKIMRKLKEKAGEITQEEYDRWRYHYPEFDNTQRWAKVPSQGLSDLLVDALNEKEEKQ